MSKILLHTYFALIAILVCSCKPGTPNGVMSASELEDVLYDMHLAQYMAQQHAYDSLAFYNKLYQQSVLKKHGIQQADFDRTMEWYSGHTKQLSEVYTKLGERLGDTSSAGKASDGQSAPSGNFLSGDTINIWHGPSSALLTSQGRNRFVFKEEADTSLQAGDLLKWVFAADWHYHEGERRALAVLIIHYEGDSTAVTQQFVNSAGFQIVSTHVAQKKVKSIEGFVYQDTQWSERPRILNLSYIQMWRVHIRKEKPSQEAGEAADTTRRLEMTPQKRLLDSLKRQDTLNEKKPHFR